MLIFQIYWLQLKAKLNNDDLGRVPKRSLLATTYITMTTNQNTLAATY